MNPILREYLLKGLFLGLWAFLAIVQEPAAPDWPRFGRALAWMAGGLGLGLLAGGLVQVRRGYRPAANLKAFPLVVLFESPFWIFAGIIGGLALGIVIEYAPPPPGRDWLLYCAAGGALLGLGFHQHRCMKGGAIRAVLAAAIGGLLTWLVLDALGDVPAFAEPGGRRVLGAVILAGLPFFYLLTFCGEAEESEVEIAAVCAGFGLGLYLLIAGRESLFGEKFVFLAPILLYFVYVTRWLPFLKVFKHTLRGYSALNLNQPVAALLSFKRALALSPKDELATGGLWELHQRIDVAALPPDSPLLDHLDYAFCLDQASALLVGGQPPSEAQRGKAERMLDLVERQKPIYAARVDYLRAVSLVHAKRFDDAAATLSKLLNPETPYGGKVRDHVLFDAWDLALRLHPEMAKRLGEAELAKPGRRMQAIAAAEQVLAANPQHSTALDLKAVLYAGLSESEFAAAAASGPPVDFNYDYAEQLGLALEGERGMAFLRMAGRGLPERGPIIFTKLAELAEANGNQDAARGYREQVKRCGVEVGPKLLDGESKGLYFAALRKLAEDAEARGDFDGAIGDYRMILENGSGELELYRKLAGLYEQLEDPMNALLMTETALVYNGKDKDLLAKKDQYYYSVSVERLEKVKDKVFRFFDVDYCAKKAKQILDVREADHESLDWALHLARLAKVIKPADVSVRLVEARALLRKGDRDGALQQLEDIREMKPDGSADDAWYPAVKILGDLYQNELERPDLAVNCYLAYRDYSKSGADTYFQIARCYEASGDTSKAIRFYENVTAYEQHPKYWDAKNAIDRLKTGTA